MPVKKKKETAAGMHKMPNGMMMPDKEMKKKMSRKGNSKKMMNKNGKHESGWF